MPGTLVVLATLVGPVDGNNTGDEVGGTGKDEGDGCAEAEGFDDLGVDVSVVKKEGVGFLTVGKKFLNPLAAKCMCCMNANSQSFGSFAASFSPAKEDVPLLAPTVSARMRPFASSRSSG